MESMEVVTVSGVRGYMDAAGTAWLNAEDVARGLGFVKTEEKNSPTRGRKTYTSVRWDRVNGYLREFGFSTQVGKEDYVPENMFYRLAMKANNAAAQAFQAKVADEIMPSIRKTGFYGLVGGDPRRALTPTFLRQIADRIETLEAEVAELKPDAEYCRRILQSVESVAVSVIAQDYGMSGIRFNQLLKSHAIQHKIGEVWILNQAYAKEGYVKLVTTELANGLTRTQMYWTQKGRRFLYHKLKKSGIVPLIERREPMAALFEDKIPPPMTMEDLIQLASKEG